MSKDSSLRIIVTGLIAQHPWLGGVAWDYVQYPAGLARLGHDVYYFEDSGEWPYNRDGGASGDQWIAHDYSAHLDHLAQTMRRFGLEDRWAYRFPIKPRWHGLSAQRRREVLESADLLINVSGTLKRPEDYRRVKRLVYIDSDPGFTQVKLMLARGQKKFQARVNMHDCYFSFGENLAAAMPESGREWRRTRQPVLLSAWRPESAHRNVYTTVMSWTSYKPLRYRGQVFGQKDIEFKRYAELPRMLPGVEFEVAMNQTQHAEWETERSEAGGTCIRRSPREQLGALGWHIVDAATACAGIDDYRNYIETSKAEWSVAKSGYVVARTGWFSCRSACYLAAGRPVVVQDTAFGAVLPTGEGILKFATLDDAVHAVREIEGNYERHARAARGIAETYFDSDKVLQRLLADAFSHGN